jgi:hypothetical protein
MVDLSLSVLLGLATCAHSWVKANRFAWTECPVRDGESKDPIHITVLRSVDDK